MLNGSMIGRETAKFVSRNPDHIHATTIFSLANFTRRTSALRNYFKITEANSSRIKRKKQELSDEEQRCDRT